MKCNERSLILPKFARPLLDEKESMILHFSFSPQNITSLDAGLDGKI